MIDLIQSLALIPYFCWCTMLQLELHSLRRQQEAAINHLDNRTRRPSNHQPSLRDQEAPPNEAPRTHEPGTSPFDA